MLYFPFPETPQADVRLVEQRAKGFATQSMLEALIHIERPTLPPTFTLLKVEIPDELVQRLQTGVLPLAKSAWITDQTMTQAIGDSWLAQAPSAVLQVPSAVVIEGCNYLLNPLHPDAKRCKIIEVLDAPWDKRIRS